MADTALSLEDYKNSKVGRELKLFFGQMSGTKAKGAKFDEVVALYYLDSKNLAENSKLKINLAIAIGQRDNKSNAEVSKKFLDEYKSEQQTKIAECITRKK